MEDYIAQERNREAAIEEALEQYDTLRERVRRLNPVANGVTLYPDTDDGLTVAWTERHPKRVTITYFID